MDDTDNYVALARAIIARACLDYIATQHPRDMKAYLTTWLCPSSHSRVTVEWTERQHAELADGFANGLGELAEAVGVRHWIRKARQVTRPGSELAWMYKHLRGRQKTRRKIRCEMREVVL